MKSSALAKVVDSLAEFSILGSYTKWGYHLRSPFFAADDLSQDLSGKTFLITGANSGIGLATSLALAQRNAKVLLLCRNPEKGQAALQQIEACVKQPECRPRLFLADLSDLQSIIQAAETISREIQSLHGVLHNAGNGLTKKSTNAQGVDSMFCTNVLATYVLTQKLLPQLRQSGSAENPARVLWVSSGGMYTSGLNTQDLEWKTRKYEWLKVYAENKRAQVTMAEWFSEQEAPPPKVIFHSMHPGWVDTELVQKKLPGFQKILGHSLRSKEQGADTLVWLAVSREAAQCSGKFWLDRKPRATVLWPGTRVKAAQKADLIKLCQELANQK